MKPIHRDIASTIAREIPVHDLNSVDLKSELNQIEQKIRDLIKIQHKVEHSNNKSKKKHLEKIKTEVDDLKCRSKELKKDIKIYEDMEKQGCFGSSLFGRCISGLVQVAAVPLTVAANFAGRHPILAAGIILSTQITSVLAAPSITKQQVLVSEEKLKAQANVDNCGEHSFLAIVKNRNTRIPNGACTGTVVSKNKILTAQHCTTQFGWGKPTPLSPRHLVVHQGCETSAEILTNPNCTYNVVNIENLPSYIQGAELNDANDLSLVTVDRPFLCAEKKSVISDDKYTDFKKECHKINHEINHDTKATPKHNVNANGWGVNHHDRKHLSETPKTVPLTTYHNASEPLCERMICAQNFDKTQILDTCQGDSGGPLFSAKNNEYVGVTSSGSSDCKGGNSLYVDIHRHKDWIQEHTKDSVDDCMDIQIIKNHSLDKKGQHLSLIKITNNCDVSVETKFKSDCSFKKERRIETAAGKALQFNREKTVTVADCRKGPTIRNSEKPNN